MILIIGATGWTGSEATRQLVFRGEEVRALSRDRAKAKAMSALAGAEIVEGDSTKPDTLDAVFAGVHKVFLVPPTDLGWDQMQSGLISAARRAGVQQLVKLSAVGVGPDKRSMSHRYHWKGEQEVEASGIAFTHVRGNSFFQNTLFELATINAEGRFYDCVGNSRFAKVDTRDIGEVVAKVLTEDGHEGQTYELTGPEPLSYYDIADQLSAVLGREIQYVDVSAGERAARLESAGLPGWMAKEFADIYGAAFYREGGGAYTTDHIQSLLGRAPRRYDDFVRDYADAFK